MRRLSWLLGLIVAGYAGVVALLYMMQREMLYHPPHTHRITPAAMNFPQAEEVILDTADGEKVVAWHVPPADGRLLVLFLHGNGDSIAYRVSRFRDIVSDGTGLLALSFRGYAGSSGEPTEQGLVQDAEAAYLFARARYPAGRIAIWGYSLGTGLAVMTAAKHPVAKLVLEAPYTSIADIAVSLLPFGPVRLLMKDQYRSDAHIAKISAPLLVMHGERDQVVDFHLGRKLYEMAPDPKRFVAFPSGMHEDLDRHGAVAVVRDFLYHENTQ